MAIGFIGQCPINVRVSNTFSISLDILSSMQYLHGENLKEFIHRKLLTIFSSKQNFSEYFWIYVVVYLEFSCFHAFLVASWAVNFSCLFFNILSYFQISFFEKVGLFSRKQSMCKFLTDSKETFSAIFMRSLFFWTFSSM